MTEMSPKEFVRCLDVIDPLSLKDRKQDRENRVANVFRVTPRTLRRYESGDEPVPRQLTMLLRLAVSGKLTLKKLERI